MEEREVAYTHIDPTHTHTQVYFPAASNVNGGQFNGSFRHEKAIKVLDSFSMHSLFFLLARRKCSDPGLCYFLGLKWPSGMKVCMGPVCVCAGRWGSPPSSATEGVSVHACPGAPVSPALIPENMAWLRWGAFAFAKTLKNPYNNHIKKGDFGLRTSRYICYPHCSMRSKQ